MVSRPFGRSFGLIDAGAVHSDPRQTVHVQHRSDQAARVVGPETAVSARPLTFADFSFARFRTRKAWKSGNLRPFQISDENNVAKLARPLRVTDQ